MSADDRHYLEERYRPRPPSARALPLFYRVKPLIPRPLQMAVRRAMARRQRRRHEHEGAFPRWPIEPLLVERRAAEPSPWPDGRRFAYILTHDVEGPRGLANVEPLLEIERRHGMRSAWFLVAEAYPIDPAVPRAILDAGGEVALHGLRHDGSLFQSRAEFERQLPRVHNHLRRWGADGFRSPATHRRAPWMAELGCRYDSSFPDTHPFDAQPGGCCSILPFFLGDVVELPITLPQDHTLFELLRERDISLWRRKAAWIAEHGGLVTALVHPDYALTADRLAHYDELLGFLASLGGGWHALPREVADWWRRRAALNPDALEGDAHAHV